MTHCVCSQIPAVRPGFARVAISVSEGDADLYINYYDPQKCVAGRGEWAFRGPVPVLNFLFAAGVRSCPTAVSPLPRLCGPHRLPCVNRSACHVME